MENHIEETADPALGYEELRRFLFNISPGTGEGRIIALRAILTRYCRGTPSLVDYLVDEFACCVGYKVGDVVSDIRPDDWLMQLGMRDEYERSGTVAPEGPQYGVFDPDGTRCIEEEALFFGGVRAGIPDRKERNQRWLDEFTLRYGEAFSAERCIEEAGRYAEAYRVLVGSRR